MKKELSFIRFSIALIVYIIIMSLMALTILSILLSADLYAEGRAYCVTTHVLAEGGEYAMSKDQYKQCHKDAQTKISEMGACLKIKTFDYYPTPVIGGQHIDAIPNNLNGVALGQVLRRCSFRKKYFKRPTFCMAMLPQTILPNSDRYISGLASSICSNTERGHSGTFLIRAGYENTEGANRKPHCVISYAHEAGHALGAYHKEVPNRNLMNTNISPFVGDSDNDWKTVEVLQSTINEVANCKQKLINSNKYYKDNKRNNK